MSDADLTKLCHQALGYEIDSPSWPTWMLPWNPLHDDAQAMALEDWLLERGKLMFNSRQQQMIFSSWDIHDEPFARKYYDARGRRRAICECVAKMYGERN